MEYEPVRYEAEELTSERAKEIFERYQLLWVRLRENERRVCKQFNFSKIQELYERFKFYFKAHWATENKCEYSESELAPSSVLNKENVLTQAFYVSCILQRNEELTNNLFEYLPFAIPSILSDAFHDDGAWLFIGQNPLHSGEGRKRSRMHELTGRPEHVDDVDHAGTWHIQLNGRKTWKLRPNIESNEWKERRSRHPSQLLLEIDEGELLVINTRFWYHSTVIPPQSGYSISCARDFYWHQKERSHEINSIPKANDIYVFDPRLLAKNSCNPGEVVLVEEDIPDEIPRSKEASCQLAEVIIEGDEKIVMVATRRIEKGEPLTVPPSDDESYEEVEYDVETGEIVKAPFSKTNCSG